MDKKTWKQKAARDARERGQSYINTKNILIPRKQPKMGTLCREKCRLKCSEKITESERAELLNQFYNLSTNAKNALLFGCIKKVDVGRVRKNAAKHKEATYKYEILVNGSKIQICKPALAGIYQIGRKKIDLIKSHVASGVTVPPEDRRGRHSSRPNKLDDQVVQLIKDHISQFPAEISHYSSNKNLSPLLSISKMYQHYMEKVKNLPEKFHVKKCSYNKIFVTEFSWSLSAKSESYLYSTCDAGKSNSEHLENVHAGFDAMKKDRELAKTTDGNF